MDCDEVPFQVKAFLGSVTLSKESFLELKPQDIILLDQQVTEPLALEISEMVHIFGYGGIMERQRAIKIERWE